MYRFRTHEEADADTERRVFFALARLPDRAVDELKPGEVSAYGVIRVDDEIVVALMAEASGFRYADAAVDITTLDVDGVAIPFASPRLLWRMKRSTHRDKDGRTYISDVGTALADRDGVAWSSQASGMAPGPREGPMQSGTRRGTAMPGPSGLTAPAQTRSRARPRVGGCRRLLRA